VTLRLTEEQSEIRALARDFSAREIRPFASEWDARRALDPAVFSKLGELGFMGMRAPEAFGGLALDLVTYLLVLEEVAWGDASVALGLAIHAGPVTDLLQRYGTEAQKERYLPRVAAGELLGAFALSEAEAGSDARSLASAWKWQGSDRVLTGAKKWVTNGGLAGLVIVFARDSEEGRISAFLLDPERHEYEIGKREVTMGLAASETVELRLNQVLLGEDSLLGEEGQGFRYAMKAMEVGRLGIAAQAIGIARAAFEHARGYAKERVQFGRPLSEFQATQFKLAEMITRITRVRALTLSAASVMEEGSGDGGEFPSPGVLAAMAKLSASEGAVWTADEAVQIFGGYGYMRDYPVERLLRDAKGTEIYEGTNEIMRLVIARDVLREGRSDR
jgi:alkylation response protein AidB-like acyl-CoA dehydrogenase